MLRTAQEHVPGRPRWHPRLSRLNKHRSLSQPPCRSSKRGKVSQLARRTAPSGKLNQQHDHEHVIPLTSLLLADALTIRRPLHSTNKELLFVCVLCMPMPSAQPPFYASFTNRQSGRCAVGFLANQMRVSWVCSLVLVMGAGAYFLTIVLVCRFHRPNKQTKNEEVL